MPSGMVPLKELSPRNRYLHPGEHMHIPGDRRISSTLHTVHTSHNDEKHDTSISPSVEDSSSTTAFKTVPATADNQGHWTAHMASTHVSEVRAEMPSGMVPLRKLESRRRPLHPGSTMHMHTPECSRTPSHYTGIHHSSLCDMRGDDHQEQNSTNNRGHQWALHCTNCQHSLQRGESGDAVRDGAIQGALRQVKGPVPRGSRCAHQRTGGHPPPNTPLMPPRNAR